MIVMSYLKISRVRGWLTIYDFITSNDTLILMYIPRYTTYYTVCSIYKVPPKVPLYINCY
jgi:hypothetical protein